MKLGLIALCTAFSNAAFACPSLQGVWTCTEDGQQASDVTVTQQDIPGGVHYTTVADGYTEELYVDGTPHSETDEDGYITTTTLSCQADSGFNGTGRFDAPDQSFSIDSTLTYTLPDANSFNGTTTSILHTPGQADDTETSTIACTRK